MSGSESKSKQLAPYSLGLDWDQLILVPYNPLWPALYETEAKRLRKILEPWLINVEHVGSSSVPYYGGKPIIDIIAAVSLIDTFPERINDFIALGYSILGECGRPGRYFLTYNRGKTTLFHLHVVQKDSDYWRDLLSFRNFLRSNRKFSLKYHNFKCSLLRKYKNNRTFYRLAKGIWFDENRQKTTGGLYSW